MESKSKIFRIIIICACIILLIGLILPYETAVGEHKEYLQKNPDSMYAKEINLKNKDVKNISILENFRVYSYIMNHDTGSSWNTEEATINFILTIALFASIILVTLFALLSKKVLSIIFGIVLLASSLLMNYDIVSRKVIPSSNYTYGISFFLYPIISLIILVSVFIFIKKKNKNKE